MNKFSFLFLVMVCLLALPVAVYANPYASQLDASVVSIAAPTDDVTLSFYLNEAATAMLEVYGPLPATTVRCTFDLGALERGAHDVIWDGTDETAGDYAPSGDYAFRVTADSDGYGGWTNITPIETLISADWVASTTPYTTAGANTVRGIGFDGTYMYVSSTAPTQQVAVVNSASGEWIHNLSTTITDPYDADIDGATNDTWSLAAWLGPYDMASNGSNVFLSAYRGADFPIAKLVDPATAGSNPVAVAMKGAVAANDRAIDAVNGLLYQISATTPNTVTIYAASGSIYVATETATMTGSHAVIGRDGNAMVDGDVVWTSANTGYVHRYVRTGGAWVEDANFLAAQVPFIVGGDYFQMGGKDYVVGVGYSVVTPDTFQRVSIYDGTTGELKASWVYPAARVYNDGNGDCTAVVTGTQTGKIYFGFSEHAAVGRLSFSIGELGSAQYYAPTGVTVISDESSPYFGQVFVANAWPAASGNPGAVAAQQGVYMLNSDLSFAGGSESAAYGAANNPPSPTFDPTDSWSPWKLRVGRDENVLFLGDWGTRYVTDNIYRYTLDAAASAILVATPSAGNHGRVYTCMSYGTGAAKRLVGLDRDLDSGGDVSYYEAYYWDIGEATEDYTGAANLLLEAPNTGVGVTVNYTMRDIVVAASGAQDLLFVANRRSSNAQTMIYCVDITNPAAKTLVWAKTGADNGWPSDCGPSGLAVNADAGLLYVLLDATRQVAEVNMADGVQTSIFTYGTSGGGRAIGIDPAGNIITTDNGSEHVRIWSPGAASTYTTASPIAVNLTSPSADVNDWMVY